MANKIIRIGEDESESVNIVGEDKYIVYRDVSMIAGKSQYNRHPTPEDKDNYEAYLTTEPTSKEIFDYICTEGDETDRELLLLWFSDFKDYDRVIEIWQKYGRWKIEKNINVKAIQVSLDHIFQWIPGERILNPEFGSKLRYLLYEGITDYNVEQIMAEIQHAVLKWEPRVVIDKVVNVQDVNDTEDNVVHLQIVYHIPGLSDIQYAYSLKYHRSN